ncbi:MAG: hypothetical protein ACOCP9_00015 [Halofilum sp. (in: g-proteobacteria)]
MHTARCGPADQPPSTETVTLRPFRRDAACHYQDPEAGELLEHASRLGILLAPDSEPDLFVTDASHAGAAIALLVATPMRTGQFRGCAVWRRGRRPPDPPDYVLLENGSRVSDGDRPGPADRFP